jgi:hypothetical protein
MGSIKTYREAGYSRHRTTKIEQGSLEKWPRNFAARTSFLLPWTKELYWCRLRGKRNLLKQIMLRYLKTYVKLVDLSFKE